MSRTFIYALAVVAVYIFLVVPKMSKSEEDKTESEQKTHGGGGKKLPDGSYTTDTQSGTGLNENGDENGISQEASGQQKYRIGYTK